MAFVAASSTFAGGLLTNTNQNAAFVRNFALEGKMELTSIYANPAGGAFLNNGWHLSLNTQTAFQERNIDTTFPLFQYNTENHDKIHRFEGEAIAPLVPSFTVSYNRDKWSLSAHFAIIGGGGKCEFKQGLGSFESIGASIPSAVVAGIQQKMLPMVKAQLMASPYNFSESKASVMAPDVAMQKAIGAGPDSYSMNSSMKGHSYYFGLQLGGTYKILENLSAYLGIRGVYGTASYTGFVGDLELYNSTTGATALPAEMGGTPYIDLVRQSYGDVEPYISMNCDQTAFGVSPVIGVDWKINDHWNVSAKYEFKTKMNLKNSSQMSEMAKLLANTPQGEALGQFKDGAKVREDIPALLALGAQYSPIEKVRIDAAYHQFFDKDSKKYADKQKYIKNNTHEFILGAEYDICKLITISGSWEYTRYGLKDQFMNDLSFNLSNYMFGGGVRVHATKRLNIDLGYMCTFYNSRNVTTQVAPNVYKTDHYDRTNHTFGIGVNLDF